MYMINGIDTTLYGKKFISYKELKRQGIIKDLPKETKFKPYIATKWFVIFFIPILPWALTSFFGKRVQTLVFLLTRNIG